MDGSTKVGKEGLAEGLRSWGTNYLTGGRAALGTDGWTKELLG